MSKLRTLDVYVVDDDEEPAAHYPELAVEHCSNIRCLSVTDGTTVDFAQSYNSGPKHVTICRV
jgi:hypothetical protein